MQHARVCREEEELTVPWEGEAWEQLSLSDGIPACSMTKITGISVIAEPTVLVEEEKTAGPWPMAQ